MLIDIMVDYKTIDKGKSKPKAPAGSKDKYTSPGQGAGRKRRFMGFAQTASGKGYRKYSHVPKKSTKPTQNVGRGTGTTYVVGKAVSVASKPSFTKTTRYNPKPGKAAIQANYLQQQAKRRRKGKEQKPGQEYVSHQKKPGKKQKSKGRQIAGY